MTDKEALAILERVAYQVLALPYPPVKFPNADLIKEVGTIRTDILQYFYSKHPEARSLKEFALLDDLAGALGILSYTRDMDVVSGITNINFSLVCHKCADSWSMNVRYSSLAELVQTVVESRCRHVCVLRRTSSRT